MKHRTLITFGLFFAACATPIEQVETDDVKEDSSSENGSDEDNEDNDNDNDDNINTESEEETEPENDVETETETETETEEEVFAPINGTWMVMNPSTFSMDSCNLQEHTDRGQQGSTLMITNDGDHQFILTLTLDDGGNLDTNCTINTDQSFECDEYAQYRAIDELGDANLTITVNTYGDFSSENSMSMSSDVLTQCNGNDCGWAELLLGASFPCDMTVTSELNSN